MEAIKTPNVVMSRHSSELLKFWSFVPKDRHLREFVENVRREYADNAYRQVNSGGVWSEDEPGKFGADLNTADGLVKLRGATLADGDSITTKRESRSLMSKSSGELWDQLLASSTSTDKKTEALAYLMMEGEKGVVSFVLSQLDTEELPLDWRDKLIFATEQLVVTDPDKRERMKQLLYRHASSLLHSGRFQSESTLWAAIRRYGSLVEESEVQTLRSFLDGETSISTRQVALQAIHSIFQQSPPKQSEGLSDLTARVHELAIKFVDPDLLVSPENTSMALNALVALCSLGAASSVQLAHKLKETVNRWLIRRATDILEAMLKRWEAVDEKTDNQKSAIRNVSESLASLRF